MLVRIDRVNLARVAVSRTVVIEGGSSRKRRGAAGLALEWSNAASSVSRASFSSHSDDDDSTMRTRLLCSRRDERERRARFCLVRRRDRPRRRRFDRSASGRLRRRPRTTHLRLQARLRVAHGIGTRAERPRRYGCARGGQFRGRGQDIPPPRIPSDPRGEGEELSGGEGVDTRAGNLGAASEKFPGFSFHHRGRGSKGPRFRRWEVRVRRRR